MNPELVEQTRQRIRENPGGAGWKLMVKIPPDERHPSMRDLPYEPVPSPVPSS
jgi:hypothetical protein